MVHGFGQATPGLRRANGKGGSDSAVMATYALDGIGGTTGMRVQFVKVRAAGGRVS
jgi:hypothetical protein